MTEEFIYGRELIPMDARVHYRPQYTFIYNEGIKNVDYIMRFENLNDVRTGKQIILDFEKLEENEAVLKAKKMCEDLLVNTIIEKYKINILRN